MSDMTSFFLNLLSGGIVGAIASFVASKYFLEHNNQVNKPKIQISDKLIETTREDGTPALQIKIINKTNQDIANVIFEVDGMDNLSPTGSIPLYRYTRIGRREVLYIKKYNNSDTDAHYAHRTNLINEKNDILIEYKRYTTIQISIKVECPYYGTAFVTSKIYKRDEDILNNKHSFNTGDSLSCSSH